MTDATLKRYAEAIRTCRLPVVEVAIEPASPDAPLSPVVEVRLKPARHVSTRIETAHVGAACSSSCGQCGHCTEGVNVNCTCADCGAPFWKGEHDSDSYCDGCRDLRDAHTDALEIRMAKARLPVERKKEIAS